MPNASSIINSHNRKILELAPNNTTRGIGSIKKLGGGGAPVSRGTFGMKRAPKKMFPEMLATGEGGGGGGGGGKGRKNKCNHKSKAVEADSRMRSNENDQNN